MKISIVIPAYNEEKRIKLSLEKIQKFVEISGYDIQVIVVDDGSTDNTIEVVQEVGLAKIVSYEQNRGKGFALKAGVQIAEGDLIYICDSDLSTPIEFLDKFIELQKKSRAHIVIGNRKKQDSKVEVSFLRKISGQFGNILIRNLLGVNFQDTQCGFKLFTKESALLFDKLTVDRWGFDFEILKLAQLEGYKVVDMAVEWQEVKGGKVRFSSYLNTLKDLFYVWWKYR